MHVDGFATTLYYGDNEGTVQLKNIGGNSAFLQEDNGWAIRAVGFDGSAALWLECEDGSTACRVRKQSGSGSELVVDSFNPIFNLQWDASHVFYNQNSGLYKAAH